MREMLYLAIAGALGALSRYGLSGLSYRVLGEAFPWGTLVVNVLGSFLIGLIAHLGLSTDVLSPASRTAVTVGFLGALTTFSTFSYETIGYLEDGDWRTAALNITANLIACLLAVAAGMALGRLLTGGG